jgi:hypothetical protein
MTHNSHDQQFSVAGPTERPLVVQFSDIDSAVEWFDNSTAGFTNEDNCAEGDVVDTWSHDYVTAGVVGCYYAASSDFRILWLIDRSLIGVVVDGSNGPAMYAWWMESAYVISSDG